MLRFGLIGRGLPHANEITVPLVGVSVSAEVHDFIAEVKVCQCFQNTQEHDIDVVYHFPFDEASAVCGFKAEYDDGVAVDAIIRERETARKEYRTAIWQGKQAQLMESVRPDIFSMSAGRMSASSFLKISMTYITLLKPDGEAARFLLPTHVAARYSPDAGANIGCESSVRFFGLDFDISFWTSSPIKTLTSPTHQQAITATILNTSGKVQLNSIALDGDLIILCEEENPHQPRACIEVDSDGSLVGVVTLFPEIEFKDRPREIIFLVDQSGSMGLSQTGCKSQMEQAKEALQLFLRALPPDCTFNVVGFGSSFKSLFAFPREYDEETLQEATHYVGKMKPNLGGTDILPPLRKIFDAHPPSTAQHLRRERQVFVLTDGQVSNEADVFALVQESCRTGTTRTFSLGIGANVSHHLVEGIARAGKGSAAFVMPSNGEDASKMLRTKVLGQLKQALQPGLGNVSVVWNFPPTKAASPALENAKPAPVKTLLGYRSPELRSEPSSPQPRTFPSVAPVVLTKERFVSFAVFSGSQIPTSVTVSADSPDGPLEVTLEVGDDNIFHGDIAHKMAARTAIREYEESSSSPKGALSKKAALDIALKYSLVSQQTSFVAVRSDSAAEATGEDARKAFLPRTQCLFSALGLASGADEVEVRKAYRKLALKHHPDRGGDGTTFEEITRAFQVLSDPERRRLYEAHGEDALACEGGGMGAGCEELFGAIFGGGAGFCGGPTPSKPATAAQQHRDGRFAVTQEADSEDDSEDEDPFLNLFPDTDEEEEEDAVASATVWQPYSSDNRVRAAAAPHAASIQGRACGAAAAAAAPAEEAEDSEVESESDGDMGFGLFDSDSEDGAVPVTHTASAAQSGASRSAGAVRKQVPPQSTTTVESAKSSNSLTSGDGVMELCMLQKASGSFDLSDVAAFLRLGSKMTMVLHDDVRAATGEVVKADRDVILATVLAVAAMRSLFADDRDVWELQEAKAVRLLAAAGLEHGVLAECVAMLKRRLWSE